MKFKDQLRLMRSYLSKAKEDFIMVDKAVLFHLLASAQFADEAMEEIKAIRKNSGEEETRDRLLDLKNRLEKLLQVGGIAFLFFVK